METERLVEVLASDLTLVRRVGSPGARLGWWLLISLPAAAAVAWISGLRPDLLAKLYNPVFLVEEAAALLTAVVGAYAALCAGLPDEPSWKLWLPLAPMAVWLGALGNQCLDAILRYGPQGLQISSDAMCLPAIALGGVVPALAIVIAMRRTMRFRVVHASFCGGLGAAALGAAALRLYHQQDAAIMVIVWQLGSVALLSLLAGGIGRAVVSRQPSPAYFAGR